MEEEGAVLAPARKLWDIVKALGSEGMLTFNSNENFEINLVTSFGKYKMKGIDPDEYLSLPKLFEEEFSLDQEEVSEDNIENSKKWAKLSQAEMTRIATKTGFAVSTDEFRASMTGVLFQFLGDKMLSVSTDGYRLVKAITFAGADRFPEDLNVIIPSKIIDLLKKVDNETIVSTIETKGKITHIRFTVGDTTMISRVIDENFPPYENAIPKENHITAQLNQKSVLNAIKRVSIFANPIAKKIKFMFDPSMLTVYAEDEDTGANASETLECEYNAEPLTMGFNFKFLEEAIQNIDTKEDQNHIITFLLSTPSKAALLSAVGDENLLMLVMPIRV